MHTLNSIIAEFKRAFPWTNYLIAKPVLVDENGCKIWFQEDIDPNVKCTKKLFIGINQYGTENCCIWLHAQHAASEKRSLTIDYDWKDFVVLAIPFDNLNDQKYSDLTATMLAQLQSICDNGDNISTYRGILMRS